MLTITGPGASEFVLHRKDWVDAEGHRGQLDPRLGVNIDMLPDDVLLEIFGVFMDDDFDRRHQGTWLRLVHVCRRWRCLVFASPRHLDLRLFCTPRRLLNNLDIWPELPIVIFAQDIRSKKDSDRNGKCR